MSPIIIGFGYKARNGKDTCASRIKQVYGGKYNIEITSFGKVLKEEVNELDQLAWCLREGIPYNFNIDMSDPLCQTNHGKQGKLLQWYGTEYMRNQNPFYWVNKVKNYINNELPKNTQIVLIPDVRFKDEFLFIRSKQGYTVKCTRLGYTDLNRDQNHKSENELNDAIFDYEITAEEGDLAGLHRDIESLFESICAHANPVTESAGEYVVNAVNE